MRATFIATSIALLSIFSSPSHTIAQDSTAVLLDSVFVEASIVPVIDPADSAQSYNMAVLDLHFDVIEDLGYLSVVVYDTLSGMPIGEFLRSRQELINEGLLLPDHVIWPLFQVQPEFTYRIEVTPQSLSGAYSRIGTVLLSN